jgi:hypothetical protein
MADMQRFVDEETINNLQRRSLDYLDFADLALTPTSYARIVTEEVESEEAVPCPATKLLLDNIKQSMEQESSGEPSALNQNLNGNIESEMDSKSSDGADISDCCYIPNRVSLKVCADPSLYFNSHLGVKSDNESDDSFDSLSRSVDLHTFDEMAFYMPLPTDSPSEREPLLQMEDEEDSMGASSEEAYSGNVKGGLDEISKSTVEASHQPQNTHTENAPALLDLLVADPGTVLTIYQPDQTPTMVPERQEQAGSHPPKIEDVDLLAQSPRFIQSRSPVSCQMESPSFLMRTGLPKKTDSDSDSSGDISPSEEVRPDESDKSQVEIDTEHMRNIMQENVTGFADLSIERADSRCSNVKSPMIDQFGDISSSPKKIGRTGASCEQTDDLDLLSANLMAPIYSNDISDQDGTIPASVTQNAMESILLTRMYSNSYDDDDDEDDDEHKAAPDESKDISIKKDELDDKPVPDVYGQRMRFRAISTTIETVKQEPSAESPDQKTNTETIEGESQNQANDATTNVDDDGAHFETAKRMRFSSTPTTYEIKSPESPDHEYEKLGFFDRQDPSIQIEQHPGNGGMTGLGGIRPKENGFGANYWSVPVPVLQDSELGEPVAPKMTNDVSEVADVGDLNHMPRGHIPGVSHSTDLTEIRGGMPTRCTDGSNAIPGIEEQCSDMTRMFNELADIVKETSGDMCIDSQNLQNELIHPFEEDEIERKRKRDEQDTDQQEPPKYFAAPPLLVVVPSSPSQIERQEEDIILRRSRSPTPTPMTPCLSPDQDSQGRDVSNSRQARSRERMRSPRVTRRYRSLSPREQALKSPAGSLSSRAASRSPSPHRNRNHSRSRTAPPRPVSPNTQLITSPGDQTQSTSPQPTQIPAPITSYQSSPRRDPSPVPLSRSTPSPKPVLEPDDNSSNPLPPFLRRLDSSLFTQPRDHELRRSLSPVLNGSPRHSRLPSPSPRAWQEPDDKSANPPPSFLTQLDSSVFTQPNDHELRRSLSPMINGSPRRSPSPAREPKEVQSDDRRPSSRSRSPRPGPGRPLTSGADQARSLSPDLQSPRQGHSPPPSGSRSRFPKSKNRHEYAELVEAQQNTVSSNLDISNEDRQGRGPRPKLVHKDSKDQSDILEHLKTKHLPYLAKKFNRISDSGIPDLGYILDDRDFINAVDALRRAPYFVGGVLLTEYTYMKDVYHQVVEQPAIFRTFKKLLEMMFHVFTVSVSSVPNIGFIIAGNIYTIIINGSDTHEEFSKLLSDEPGLLELIIWFVKRVKNIPLKTDNKDVSCFILQIFLFRMNSKR